MDPIITKSLAWWSPKHLMEFPWLFLWNFYEETFTVVSKHKYNKWDISMKYEVKFAYTEYAIHLSGKCIHWPVLQYLSTHLEILNFGHNMPDLPNFHYNQ